MVARPARGRPVRPARPPAARCPAANSRLRSKLTRKEPLHFVGRARPGQAPDLHHEPLSALGAQHHRLRRVLASTDCGAGRGQTGKRSNQLPSAPVAPAAPAPQEEPSPCARPNPGDSAPQHPAAGDRAPEAAVGTKRRRPEPRSPRPGARVEVRKWRRPLPLRLLRRLTQ